MAQYATRESFEKAVVKNVGRWLRGEARRFKIKTDNVDGYAQRLVSANQELVTKAWRDGNPAMQAVESTQVSITFPILIDDMIKVLEV
jgi:hypothetical protein